MPPSVMEGDTTEKKSPNPPPVPTDDVTNMPPQAVPQSNGVSVHTAISEPSIFPEQDLMQPQDASMIPNMPLMPDQQGMLPDVSLQPMSAAEIALYDRQIRLWGVRAQELIRTANILLIGIKALGNEIAKNLVLAGIGSLTILDSENVTEDDLTSQFLVNADDLGKNRAEAAAAVLRKMNPRVNVICDTDLVTNKMPDYFSPYNVVIVTGQPFDMASTINVSCRMYGVKFYAADIHGLYGYVFADLIMQQFTIEKERGNIATKPGVAETPFRVVMDVTNKRENEKTIEIVTKQEMYSPLLLANSSPLPVEVMKNRRTKLKVTPLLSCLRALFEFQKQTGRLPGHTRQDLEVYTKLAQDRHLELQLPTETLSASFLRSFMQNLGSELTPTAAFLGGQLAQDVINVVGQREQPLQNTLLFDGDEFKVPIYSLHPIFDNNLVVDEGMQQQEMTLPFTNGVSVAEA